MAGEVEMRRLRWRCRRGLLENDLVLARFLDKHGQALEGARLAAFERLIALDDNDLWDLVSGRAECREPGLQEVLAWLRAA
ncbi:MAG: succinate dehydrogenase assembly factor 2 [Burkholderiales bacterium]|nr:succinate dehydrogenase assembly factor 2 [Burkholderiales bacterium]